MFSIAPSFDSNFKFQKNTVGIKYALINNRDKAIFDFALTNEKEWNAVQTTSLREYAATLPGGVTNEKYKLARNFFLDVEDDGDGNKRTRLADLPGDYKTILQANLNKSRAFHLSTFENFRDTLTGEYNTMAQYVENRALLTIDGNFAYDRNAKFSQVNFTSEFLKGILKKNNRSNIELNLKALLNFDDDTSSNLSTDINRQTFAISGGFNWIITKNRRGQSIVELKGAVTYNDILKGIYKGEDHNKFTGEGTFRIRLTNDFWIPLDLKYDPEHGNIFGFISLKSNFDWLKGKN